VRDFIRRDFVKHFLQGVALGAPVGVVTVLIGGDLTVAIVVTCIITFVVTFITEALKAERGGGS
jgi:putative flippase GtrA